MMNLNELNSQVYMSINDISTIEKFEESACNILKLSAVDSCLYNRTIDLMDDKYNTLRAQADRKADIVAKSRIKRNKKPDRRYIVKQHPFNGGTASVREAGEISGLGAALLQGRMNNKKITLQKTLKFKIYSS